MLRDETTTETFSSFVKEHETRLRHALTARFGSEVGLVVRNSGIGL